MTERVDEQLTTYVKDTDLSHESDGKNALIVDNIETETGNNSFCVIIQPRIEIIMEKDKDGKNIVPPSFYLARGDICERGSACDYHKPVWLVSFLVKEDLMLSY